jgi:membrane protease YdiL (CAAX protease family)
MSNLPGQTELYSFTSAIAVVLFGFAAYYFLPESRILKKWFRIQKGEIPDVLLRRFIGIIFFGCLPIVIVLFTPAKSFGDFGFNPPTIETGFWTVVLSAAILPLNYYNSFSSENLKIYPQIRRKEWPLSVLVISAVSWTAYLFSYEFLFRGFLFYASIPVLGLWPAVILNTLIYSLAHLPKGVKEILGAIPFGILLCYLTYKTNSFWIAVFAHVIMALSSEWFSLRVHPEIHLKKFRK